MLYLVRNTNFIDWDRVSDKWQDPNPQIFALHLAGNISSGTRRGLLTRKINSSLNADGLQTGRPHCFNVTDRSHIPLCRRFLKKALDAMPITSDIKKYLLQKTRFVLGRRETFARRRDASQVARKVKYEDFLALSEDKKEFYRQGRDQFRMPALLRSR